MGDGDWRKEIGSAEWNARPYPKPDSPEAQRRQRLVAQRTEFIQGLPLPIEIGTGKKKGK